MEITTESPLLPSLVRHCGWIFSRCAVRADSRTGYSRLQGREYTAGISIFGEAVVASGRVSSFQNDAEHDSSPGVQEKTGFLRSERRRDSTKPCLNFNGSTGRSS